MTVALICAEAPTYGAQSGPVLLRHLVRLQSGSRVVCCHYNDLKRHVPYETLQIPLRLWWFVPVRGSRWLLRLNILCKALYLRRKLQLQSGDSVLVCVNTSEHHLARVLAWLSGARLVALVHDHWKDDLDVGPTFRAASSVLSVSDKLASEAKRLGAVSSEVLLPLCETFLSEAELEALPGIQAACVGIAGSLSDAYVQAATRLGFPVLCIGGAQGGGCGEWTQGAVVVRRIPFFERNRDALMALRRSCRALFVYQNEESADYVRYAFPSKLLDFVQTGLPVVICAPASSPVGRWAKARGWRLYFESLEDQASLARISDALRDEKIWAEEAARSRLLATGEFDPCRIHAQLEAVVQAPRKPVKDV